MNKVKQRWIRMISFVLILSIFCTSVSAEEVVKEVVGKIADQVSLKNDFPLQLSAVASSAAETVESITKENAEAETVTVNVTTRSAFQIYEDISMRVVDFESGEEIYSGISSPMDTTPLANIHPSRTYSAYVMIYDRETKQQYDATFNVQPTAFKNSYEVEVDYVQIESEVSEEVKLANEEKNKTAQEQLYAKMFESLDLPSFIDKNDAKELGHVARLEEFENSYDTIGYRNADGTNTVYLFASPVRYKDDAGVMHDADPNLTETDTIKKREGYQYVNDFGELKSYFPASLSDSKGVKIKKNQAEFEFGFTIPSNKKSTVEKVTSAVTDLFTGEANKATLKKENKLQKIEYKKLDENQMQLDAVPTLNGVKQSLTLYTVPANNKVTFWVNHPTGSRASSDSTSAVSFRDKSGETYSIGNVELQDSYEGTDESGAVHYSANNTVSILETSADRTLVEVTLDEEVTTSPVTAYPLSVSLYASTESSIQGPSYFEDRMVYSDGTVVNAESPYLIVGEADTTKTVEEEYYNKVTCEWETRWVTVNVQREAVAFMKYDIVNFIDINPNDVMNATLELREGSGNTASVQIDLKRVTEDWSESTVNSSYIDSVDEYYLGNSCKILSNSGTGFVRDFDVTTMVIDHLLYEEGISGGIPNYGFQLRSNINAVSKHFLSSEHILTEEDGTKTTYCRPKLIITYMAAETPADLGLDENKVYWIRNKSTNNFLRPTDWKHFSVVQALSQNVDVDDGTNIDQILDEQMYWKIKYDSATGTYNIIPVYSQETQLDVLSGDDVNMATVGLCTKSDFDSSKWKIVKAGEADGRNYYEIFSKTSLYTKELNVSGTVVNIYDASQFTNHWEFIEVKCPTNWHTNGHEYVTGHVLNYVEVSGGQSYYDCDLCRGYNVRLYALAPEEQDHTLPPKMYMTILALLRVSQEKLCETFSSDLSSEEIEAKERFVEAALRAVDKIRSLYSEYYDYVNKNGNYVSNIIYKYESSSYNSNSEDPNITIHVNVTEVDRKTPTLVGFIWNALSVIIPEPYNFAAAGMSYLFGTLNDKYNFTNLPEEGDGYNFVNVASDVISLIETASYSVKDEDIILKILNKKIGVSKIAGKTYPYASKLGNAFTLYSMVNTDTSEFNYAHAYRITISFYSRTVNDTFIMDCRYGDLTNGYETNAEYIDKLIIKGDKWSTTDGSPYAVLNQFDFQDEFDSWYSGNLI